MKKNNLSQFALIALLLSFVAYTKDSSKKDQTTDTKVSSKALKSSNKKNQFVLKFRRHL